MGRPTADAVAQARIPERNCVEFVQKLVQAEHLKLLPTLSGQEWITPEQLEREIKDTLMASGGRLAVADLPAEVGVDISHCEAREEQLRSRDRSVTKLRGELFSAEYLQGVAREIDELLLQTGFLATADLAARYNLPADFIRDSVFESVTTQYAARQNGIHTNAYSARVEARVRGALRGCTQPVPLVQLASRHSLDSELVMTAAQKCLAEGCVQGKVQSSVFTPKSFTDGQSSQADRFFDSYGYLTIGLAKTTGLALKDWAKAKGVEGLTLSTAFIASHLVEVALPLIAEAIAAGSWIDVLGLLPTDLTAADARELVRQLVRAKSLPADTLVLEQVAVSPSFVQSLASGFGDEAKKVAERSLSQAAGKAGKKSAPLADDDDDGGGSKKKGKKAARGKKARDADDDDDDAGGAAVGGGGGSGIDNQALCDVFADKLPDLPIEAYDELCEHIQPLLAAMVSEQQEKMRAAQQQSGKKQKSAFETIEKSTNERYEMLVLGFRALEATKKTESPLYQYLLRETVAEPLHQLLALQYSEATGTDMEVTAANRKQCLDKLVAKEGAAKVASLSKLVALFSKSKEDKDANKEAKEPKESKDTGKKGKQKSKAGKGDEDSDSDGGGKSSKKKGKAARGDEDSDDDGGGKSSKKKGKAAKGDEDSDGDGGGRSSKKKGKAAKGDEDSDGDGGGRSNKKKGKAAKGDDDADFDGAGKQAKRKKGKPGKLNAQGDEDSDGDGVADRAPGPAELYHAAAGDCQIFCRKVDKKREKIVLQEARAAIRERLKDETCEDQALVVQLGLQLASLQDGVVGLLFPKELWAFRLVAQTLAAEEVRNAAVDLCNLLDKGDGEETTVKAAALQAALAAWRDRSLSAGGSFERQRSGTDTERA